MCWFKRKNKQIILTYQKQETPPDAPINEEAVAVVWSEDKKSFGEIFFKNGTYKYSCSHLYYDDDFTGYYWGSIYSGFASFFDTVDKAKQAAEDLMQSK